MTQAWAAGSVALVLFVAPAGASTQTSLPVGRQRDGGSGIGVAFGSGCLRFRYAHRPFCRKSKTRRQGYQQNTQHEASHGISLHRSSLRNDARIMVESGILIISLSYFLSAAAYHRAYLALQSRSIRRRSERWRPIHRRSVQEGQ